tara:strand:- start:673 stop:975 length:303 start_codon:yes stop_codon:yes gene_type:complete
MRQISKEEAILIYRKKLYEHWNDEEKVQFQLFQNRLAMPFSIYHEAIGKVLKRPVFTHEFVEADSLKKEFLGEKPAPSLESILELIPEEKRMFIYNNKNN